MIRDPFAVSILGPLRVHARGAAVSLGPRQGMVLATLLLHHNTPVPSERLIDIVWERSIKAGASNLRTHIAQLRRALGHDRIVYEPMAGYRIVVAPDELDAAEFERLARDALWARALGLWRGRVLEGLPLSPAMQLKAARLEELRLHAVERYVADEQVGVDDPAEVVALLRGCLAEHPYREMLWAGLILALWRLGRTAEALAAYQDMRRTLAEGIGLEPSDPLRKLHEQILSGRKVVQGSGF